MPVTHFIKPVFIGTIQQAIRVLDGGYAGQAHLLSQTDKFRHAIRRFIGQADITHFAGLHQRIQGLQLFFYACDRLMLFVGIKITSAKSRHMTLGPVYLVKIDVIGLQAFKAPLARGNNILAS